jgi:hypothetical protein
LNSKQIKQENTKQNFKFRSGKRQHNNERFCIVIESFTWSDFVAIRSWISRASLPLGLVRAVAGRICAKRATRRRRTRKRNDDDDDKKQTKPQNQKIKNKNADQKENPVVGGYLIVLITPGSIQRVVNRLFVCRCEENLLLWPMKLLDLVL